MTAHISFLLWEIDIWQTRSWQIYPPFLSGNFTDSNSDNSYFIPTLRAYHLEDQVLADLSPIKWQFHRFLLYSESSYLADLLVKWWFHRFLPWQLTSLRAQHLADQVMADLPPFFQWQFHWYLLWQLLFHSYSESLSFGRLGVGRSTSHFLSGNFTDSCSDSSHFMTAHISCSTLRARYLVDQVLADLPSCFQMAISLDSCSDSSYFIPTLRAQHLAD